jgi:5-methylcytosine-specific restriction enzyme subunit McrC
LDGQPKEHFLSDRDEALVKKLNLMVSKIEKQAGTEILRVNSQGIMTFSHVGIVQFGRKRIEILPKLYKRTRGDEIKPSKEEIANARKNLFLLLSKAGLIPVTESDISAYGVEDDFFEFLVRLFLNDLESLLIGQLHREYTTTEDDLGKLKGKLDLKKQMAKLPSKLHLFSCIYDEFNSDNALNRVIKATLLRLISICSHPENVRRIKIFYSMLDDVKDEQIREQHFAKIRLNRLNLYYNNVVAFCRLVLLESTHTIAERPENFYGIVFNMNDVFEKYIARSLLSELKEFEVHAQESFNLCYTGSHAHDKANCKPVTPDIVVFNKGKPLAIVDIKYKLSLDRDNSVAASDIYQMVAYSKAVDCREVFLVFPKIPVNNIEPVEKEFKVPDNLGESAVPAFINITALTVELIDPLTKKLSKNCTKELGNKIRMLAQK